MLYTTAMNFIESARNSWKKNVVGQGTTSDFGTDINPISTNGVSPSDKIEIPDQPYIPEANETAPSYVLHFLQDLAQSFGLGALTEVLKHLVDGKKEKNNFPPKS